MGSQAQIARIILDCFCVILAGATWLAIEFSATPFHRGFYCDDESITYPYKESTISTAVLASVGVVLPVISIIIIEAVHISHKKKTGSVISKYYIGSKVIPNLVVQCYKIIGVFIFGVFVVEILTTTGKYSIGRLRPHFISVCQPDFSAFSCVDAQGRALYVTDQGLCTGTEEKPLHEMRLSFPSGHASLACYSMIFLALYLQARFTWTGSRLLRPLLQAVVVAMALFTCLSRVMDYKHHWNDVLAGAILGTFIACLCIFHVADLLHTFRRWKANMAERENNSMNPDSAHGGSRSSTLADSHVESANHRQPSPAGHDHENQKAGITTVDVTGF